MNQTINDLVKSEAESAGNIRRRTLYYDTEGGEWVYICPACNEYIYAPTRQEINNQRYRHAQIRPLEMRKCPVVW